MPTDTTLAVGLLILLGVSLALLAPVALIAWWQRRRERPGRADRRAELAEWTRHAAAVAHRAEQAAAEAVSAADRAATAEAARAEAWSALERAQQAQAEAARAYQESLRGRAAVDPSGPREVAHAALAAYRRGDLSQEELWRVWRWGSGWDPEHERREHALAQSRVAHRDARLRYRAAAGTERVARQAAEVARAQARALAEEAVVAAEEVAAARAR